jgi:asparagine synthase (glutamine-hydrolysing)
VALSGDGGDELFAGYRRYNAVALAGIFDQLPRAVRTLVTNDAWQRLPASPRQKSLVRQFKRFAAGLGESGHRRYFDWVSIFNERQRAALYSEEFIAQLPDADPFDFLENAFARCAGRDPVTAASLTDLVTYLPCDLMTKVDIASMAHGLECRAPFLDRQVVELAAAMPVSLKLRRGRGKRILMETFGPLLPKSLLTRSKMGFGVPLSHWFRNELRDLARDMLLDPATLRRGYFRPAAVRELVEDHLSGTFDHGYRLWSLLVFELWQRQWVDAVLPAAR